MKFFLTLFFALFFLIPNFAAEPVKKKEKIKSERSLGADVNAKVYYAWIGGAAGEVSKKVADECTNLADAVAKFKNLSEMNLKGSECSKNSDNGYKQLKCELAGIRVFRNLDECNAFIQTVTEGDL